MACVAITRRRRRCEECKLGLLLFVLNKSYFDNFDNPFPTPRDVPEKYRKHPGLQRLFASDDAYLLPAEGPVQMWAVYVLVEHYGVPLDALQHETPVDASEGTHIQGRRWLGFADLVVYDDRYLGSGENPLDVAFIAVEAMEPGKPFEGAGEKPKPSSQQPKAAWSG